MPDSVPGFDEMPLYDMPAAPAPERGPGPAPIRQAAGRRRLRARFLRAGREAVDDRDLLELLLSGRPSVDAARELAASLLDLFGTAPRALAARPDRLRRVPGLSEDAIAALKAAEALGIRMARAEVPSDRAPVPRQLRQGDRILPHPRRVSRGRGIPDSVSQPEEPSHRRRVPPRKAPSATRRSIPGRSASAAWSFRPARSSPCIRTPPVIPSPPGPTST